MSLRVLHQHCSRVEAYRLVVEDGCGEHGQVVELQPGARVGDQGEAGGMRLREAIEREGADGQDDLLLCLGTDTVGVHARTELDLEGLRLVGGAAAAERAAQLLRLPTGEVSNHHGDSQQLGIDGAVLPKVVAPGTRIGEVCEEAATRLGLPVGTSIFAGMTDGCAAQIASGATAIGSWNTVIGTNLVVKGVTPELLCDPLGAVYSHRSMDGLWLPGGASSTGAGAIALNFQPDDLPALNADAEEHGPTPLVVYPLVGTGERFPFTAPDAHGFMLGEAASKEEQFRATLQGIALWERLSFNALRALGAPTKGIFSISGGATRSGALNQFRADVMERELHLPEITEGAFGMAVLVSAAMSSLPEATLRMVRNGTVIEPKRAFTEYADTYERLLRALYERGWLPEALLQAAIVGATA